MIIIAHIEDAQHAIERTTPHAIPIVALSIEKPPPEVAVIVGDALELDLQSY